uniref:Uncharacterized protein n=1 Tax=Syphacia muris TaxID=451379 RepID=A0A0N5APA5_9BILA
MMHRKWGIVFLGENPEKFSFKTLETSNLDVAIEEVLLEVDSEIKSLVIFIDDDGRSLDKLESLNSKSVLLFISGSEFYQLLKSSSSVAAGVVDKWTEEAHNALEKEAVNQKAVNEFKPPNELENTSDVSRCFGDESILYKILCGNYTAKDVFLILENNFSAADGSSLIESKETVSLIMIATVLLSSRVVHEVPSLRFACANFTYKLLCSQLRFLQFLSRTVFRQVIEASIFETFCRDETFLLINSTLYFLRLAKMFCSDIATRVYDRFMEILYKIPSRFWVMLNYDNLKMLAEEYGNVKVGFFFKSFIKYSYFQKVSISAEGREENIFYKCT